MWCVTDRRTHIYIYINVFARKKHFEKKQGKKFFVNVLDNSFPLFTKVKDDMLYNFFFFFFLSLLSYSVCIYMSKHLWARWFSLHTKKKEEKKKWREMGKHAVIEKLLQDAKMKKLCKCCMRCSCEWTSFWCQWFIYIVAKQIFILI